MTKRNLTFLRGSSDADDPPREPGIYFGYRALLVLVAWLSPMVIGYGLNAFLIPFKDPGGFVTFIWLFPIGLFAFVPSPANVDIFGRWGLICLLLGHAFYLGVYGVLLSIGRKKVFWTLYVALLIALALNIQGCRMMGKAMEIH